MKKLIIAAATYSFIFWSCNTPSEKSISDAKTENNTEHHHDAADETIELNNGVKWVVNEEMKPFIAKGSELVEGYIRENKTDYKELAQQLKEQNNQLIKSCTMDGQSHDELHKWLHPHLKLVKDLEKEEDMKKANEIISKLQHSYQQYHQYFN